MFIGGVFIAELRLTRKELEKVNQAFKIGLALWVFLVAMIFLMAGLASSSGSAEQVFAWTNGICFLCFLVIVGYTTVSTVDCLLESAYGYGTAALTRKQIPLFLAVMLIVVAFCFAYAFWSGYHHFVWLCQQYPSHLGLIIPLGLTVEYLTYVVCTIVKALHSWMVDRRSWRMTQNLYAGWEDDYIAESNAETNNSGQISFREFCRRFD